MICVDGSECVSPACSGLKDYSPEELRWEAYQAQKQGSVERYVSEREGEVGGGGCWRRGRGRGGEVWQYSVSFLRVHNHVT